MIRSARPRDLNDLREIERAAGLAFYDLGMDSIAEDEPPTLEELAVFQEAERAWVAVDEDDRPTAYLLLDTVDGNAHIEQVTVHPDHARQGIVKSAYRIRRRLGAGPQPERTNPD
ncbi:GNAT family N-acetyltransferase [Nesterenkonia haasae]|uniref:GNAT family N-acetyltransferase n=1 Tax=Nesterenkonia haasae TaxID=2587813 RepID=UPI001F287263|nr:GNAT family N-acetyltransferase [Nesterenkonia haasae]